MSDRTLNLDALRSFVAIHETGTFRSAALRVNLSASAVSLQIAKLEDVLGHRLLQRNARQVNLTEHGELLLPQARSLLALNNETLERFRKVAVQGRIVISASHDLGVSTVPGLLRRVADLYPNLQVDVRLGAACNALPILAAGNCNLVLFNDVSPLLPGCREIRSEPLYWLMARGGRAHVAQPLPLALSETGCAWRDAAIAALDENRIPYRPAYVSDTSMGQVAALRADLAVAALPLGLAGADLVQVPETANLPKLPHTHVRIATDGSELAEAVANLAQATGPRS